jgi:2-C-methyl-D-erythritol 4-phosphate cytidylyltransferase/2-C-methyl-D-erythritol 2,4-cyclodiphosphate synthase
MGSEEAFADAVIVAAGSSHRMGGVDKLDQDLDGRTVLQRAVGAMSAGRSVRKLFVVVAPERVEAVSRLDWIGALGARVVPGGSRRQDSVAAGVRATGAEVVLVHDGARPLVTPTLVDSVAAAAREHGAAAPMVSVADSLRRVEDGRLAGAVPREGLSAAQTPQGARRELLLRAVDALADGPDEYTDEVELLLQIGADVVSVEGERSNLKLTIPDDLSVARALVRGSVGPARVGFGEDVHPFGPGLGLRLGGIDIAGAPRLHGHSDGDVVLHAIADALLGAAGLPDLGRQFPAGDPATRGIDSAELLRAVVGRLRDAGFVPASIDVTVVGSRPRLGGARLDAMRSAVAAITGLMSERVAVKASTGNLSGDEGAGRAIRATSMATVVGP